MREAVIVSTARTPIGRAYKGAFNTINVRLIAALPKTPTQKVQKHQLRSEGVTADTGDRDAAGVRVRRTRL